VLPVWIAYESGLFAQNGLDVNFQLIAGNTNMASLLSGEVQIAQGGGGEIITAVANGADPVMVANIAPVYPFIFEVRPEIKTPDDLRGKTLGVSTLGASDYIATRVVLQKFGLDPDKDVTIVQVGISGARVSAMLSNAIQGSVIDRSLTATIEAQGMHPIYDLTQEGLPTISLGIEAEGGWLNSHRDVMQRYVDSIVQAIARERQDQAFSIGVLKKYLKSDDDEAMAEQYRADLAIVPSLPYLVPEQFKDSVEQLAALDPRVRNVDVSKMVDNSFVQSAADRGLDRAG
jgi:NitT/TauT family transport system substrate-binding protein